MRINHIAGLLIERADALCHFLLCRKTARKVRHGSPHFRAQRILAAALQRFHERLGLRRVATRAQVQQALQIARYEDVHGRRSRQYEVAVLVVDTGLKKVKEHLVVIRRANQLVDRQTHALRKVSREDIAEVSGRHADIDFLALGNLFFLQKLEICVDIVDNLRHQAADVNRVCAGELHLFCREFCLKRAVPENLLDRGLRIVKVALDAHDRRVIALLRDHLKFLEAAHAALRIEDHNAGARDIRKAGHSCLAGVAAGRGQNLNLVGDAVLFRRRRHKIGQNRERHIFERDGLSVEELEIVSIVREGERRNFGCVELLVISALDAGAKLLFAVIGEQKTHHAIGHFLIRSIL